MIRAFMECWGFLISATMPSFIDLFRFLVCAGIDRITARIGFFGRLTLVIDECSVPLESVQK